ncbi:MAG: hypothetical protein LBU60_05410 [Clostridiales bacterium]|nr:hypothetical protein [Clostridiales bacterium]
MEKIAVIDLGSNSAKVVLAYVLESGHFVVFDHIVENVQIGREVSSDGFLKQSRVASAVTALKMFKKMCESHQVDRIYAVATNAVRRAKNQKSFLEEVSSTCGFKLRVISEQEEANFIYQGVVNSFDFAKGLIIDISGSSIQLIRYNRKCIINRENIRFGASTMLEKFADSKLSPEQIADEIENLILEELQRFDWLKTLESDVVFVGVGGPFRALAKICSRLKKYPMDYSHNFIIDVKEFDAVYLKSLKPFDADSHTRIKGMSLRADTFRTAMACFKAIVDFCKIENFTVSESGLREGIMYNHAMPSTVEKPVSEVLGYSIYSKLYFLKENISHVEQVYSLTVQLCKQLRVLHKLPRFYNRVLRIATLMHDCGSSVRHIDSSKHGFYFILNCGLQGATHREILLAAFVVWASKQEELTDLTYSEWSRYKSMLLQEDELAVLKIAVMLRIADSLDRSMTKTVLGINCDILGDSVIMKTVQSGDCTLEINDALNKSDVTFEKIFKKKLKIL